MPSFDLKFFQQGVICASALSTDGLSVAGAFTLAKQQKLERLPLQNPPKQKAAEQRRQSQIMLRLDS
eukprot:4992766-Amphidinium_carterae.1